MNEQFDPLEAELRALAPREPSAELKERIANRLAPLVAIRSARLWITKRITVRLALAGGMIAAGLTIAILLRQGSDRIADAEPLDLPYRPPVATAFDDALPTVWTYRRALGRSPQELDALLDRHATLNPPTSPELARIHAFTHFDNQPQPFPGEL